MIAKHKKLFSLLFSLTFFVTAVFAGILFSTKSNTVNNVSVSAASQKVETKTVESDDALLINVNNYSTYNQVDVAKMENVENTEYNKVCSWDAELPLEIHGGTTIFVDSDLILNIGGTKYTPTPNNGWQLVGYNVYVGNSLDKFREDPFVAGETIGTTEEIDPEYTGYIVIKAVCSEIDYTLRMYYSHDGETYSVQNHTFYVNTPTSFPKDKDAPPTGGNATSFKAWAIKASMVTATPVSDVLTLNTDDYNLNFVVSQTVTDGYGVEYYYVTGITGFVKTGTIVNVYTGENKLGGNFQPLVRAVWGYNYNVAISLNAKTDYSGRNADFSLAGVKKGDSFAASQSLIVNSIDTNKFVSNNNFAFYKKDNAISGGDYSIYHYGYEIAAWAVSFNAGGNRSLLYNSGDWNCENGLTGNNIEDIVDVSFGGFASVLDNFFIGGYNNILINVTPTWQAVDLNVLVGTDYTTSGTVETIATTTYNGTYQTNEEKIIQNPGQTIYNSN